MNDDEEPQEWVATPQWKRGWQEWLGECNCGWVGSYVQSLEFAQEECERHLRNKHGQESR